MTLFCSKVLKFQRCSETDTVCVLLTQGETNSSLHSLPRMPTACQKSSAQRQVCGGGRAPSRCRSCHGYCSRRKRTVFVRSAVAVAASSASSGCASSSRRAPPVHGQPTGRLPAAAVPEPGARRQPGRRGARRPAQGSIRLGIGIGVRPSAPITAGYAHPRRGAICAQELRGPAPYMLL